MNDNPPKPSLLENADLQWQDGTPWSSRFGDIYFSREGGLEETDYVFLQANRLAARWEAADAAGSGIFTIAELGFGTGLNFLRTCELWLQCAPTQLRLHFISCEKYPLQREVLRQALQSWPGLSLRDALLAAYPDHTPGYHRLLLPGVNGNLITLDLYYGDAGELLMQQLPEESNRPCVNAWFCDGFAPRVNPDMWTDRIFAGIAALSAAGATLSSYSVAGLVVRGLEANGFRTEKRKGYGHKRQMLYAEFKSGVSPAGSVASRLVQAAEPDAADAIVIGAGLAGCATAWQLARRGYRVLVLEAAPDIAQGASGNRQAVLQCRLNRTASPEWQFNLQSFLYASRLYSLLAETGHDLHWERCGVLTLESAYRHTRRSASPDTYAHYAEQVLQHVSAERASQLAGVEIQDSGTFLPDGGWLNPAALCRAYLQHPLINVHTSVQVGALRQDGPWHVRDLADRPIASAHVVVVANSYQARQFSQTAGYPVQPLRGQVSHLPATECSQALRCVVCAESYIAPASDGLHCAGASYIKDRTDIALSETEHLQNIAGIATHVESLGINAAPLAGRAGIRGGSIDFMPMIGRVALESYWEIQPELAWQEAQAGYRQGLYLNIGHGSHGLATTALAAEYLASSISREALPLQREVAACVEPLRFVLRRLRRARQRGMRGSEK